MALPRLASQNSDQTNNELEVIQTASYADLQSGSASTGDPDFQSVASVNHYRRSDHGTVDQGWLIDDNGNPTTSGYLDICGMATDHQLPAPAFTNGNDKTKEFDLDTCDNDEIDAERTSNRYLGEVSHFGIQQSDIHTPLHNLLSFSTDIPGPCLAVATDEGNNLESGPLLVPIGAAGARKSCQSPVKVSLEESLPKLDVGLSGCDCDLTTALIPPSPLQSISTDTFDEKLQTDDSPLDERLWTKQCVQLLISDELGLKKNCQSLEKPLQNDGTTQSSIDWVCSMDSPTKLQRPNPAGLIPTNPVAGLSRDGESSVGEQFRPAQGKLSILPKERLKKNWRPTPVTSSNKTVVKDNAVESSIDQLRSSDFPTTINFSQHSCPTPTEQIREKLQDCKSSGGARVRPAQLEPKPPPVLANRSRSRNYVNHFEPIVSRRPLPEAPSETEDRSSNSEFVDRLVPPEARNTRQLRRSRGLSEAFWPTGYRTTDRGPGWDSDDVTAGSTNYCQDEPIHMTLEEVRASLGPQRSVRRVHRDDCCRPAPQRTTEPVSPAADESVIWSRRLPRHHHHPLPEPPGSPTVRCLPRSLKHTLCHWLKIGRCGTDMSVGLGVVSDAEGGVGRPLFPREAMMVVDDQLLDGVRGGGRRWESWATSEPDPSESSHQESPSDSPVVEDGENQWHAGATVSPAQDSEEKRALDFASGLQRVKDYGWYWGPLSGDEAEKVLAQEPNGSFIVRDSSDERYIFSLSFKLNGLVRHVRIEHDQGNFSFGTLTNFKSHTIVDFIENAVQHSRSGRFLFFLHRRPVLGPMRVQLLHPVSRFKQVQSLQHMCRFVILKVVRHDLIDRLPLPTCMKTYLSAPQYYTEEAREGPGLQETPCERAIRDICVRVPAVAT